MHRLTRHTFGACSQRWVCSGSHTDVHEASQAASWASGDDGIARAQKSGQLKELQMKWFGFAMEVPTDAVPAPQM